jgi:hypothetical protein
MTDYMTKVMQETIVEAMAQEIEARLYRKLHFNNLVSRAEWMEQRGDHLMEHLTATTMKISIAEIASHMSTTTESRHRMAKEIAEELLADRGEQAHLFCLEKLANDTNAPKLWRDVLSFLDEMEVKDGGGMDNSRHGLREEQGACSKDDS